MVIGLHDQCSVLYNPKSNHLTTALFTFYDVRPLQLQMFHSSVLYIVLLTKEYLFESMLNGLMFVYTVFRIFFYRFHDFVLQDDLAEATKSFRCLEIVGVFFWWCIRHFTLTVFPLIFSPSVCICVCMDE